MSLPHRGAALSRQIEDDISIEAETGNATRGASSGTRPAKIPARDCLCPPCLRRRLGLSEVE